eukprot:1428162-Amphidinium_carterae.1
MEKEGTSPFPVHSWPDVVDIGVMQLRRAWPLQQDDAHNSGSAEGGFGFLVVTPYHQRSNWHGRASASPGHTRGTSEEHPPYTRRSASKLLSPHLRDRTRMNKQK